jgi:hypothetical protein
MKDGVYTLPGSIPVSVDVSVVKNKVVEVNQVRAYDSEHEWAPISIEIPAGMTSKEAEKAVKAAMREALKRAELQHQLDEGDFVWPAWEWS